jgi:ubiquinone/menaquinone biosynthesis C-methylase UbiE
LYKLNLGCGDIKLEGFENLDIKDGVDIRYGLDYPDGSVEGITISHALSRIHKKYYPKMFEEFYRVLTNGGVIRITDDNHNQSPEKFHEWKFDAPDAVGSTSPLITRKYLEDAGFEVFDVDFRKTHFKDNSLVQVNYNREQMNMFFHIEGVKNGNTKKQN